MRSNQYDLIVIGAGAAGMTAALVGAIEGMQVLLIEKSDQVGGTSARSAGTLWIPGNHFLSEQAANDDIDEARTYLNSLVGNNSPAAMRDVFLKTGPEMLNFLCGKTGIQFKHCPHHADYHPEHCGARQGGRPVEADIFDGRELGESFNMLRPPIKEFMVLGGMMVSKADIDLLLTAGKTIAGTAHAIQLGIRYLLDRSRRTRGSRLTMGNALCASLLHECLRANVEVLAGTDVSSIEAIEKPNKSSHRLTIQQSGTAKTVTASNGVVFAGGGFSGKATARRQHMPQPTPQHTAAFEGADGSSQALALALGAQLGPAREHNAWWFPSSVVPRIDGTVGVFPHIIMDRAKPGLIAVNKDGHRFTNEGASYHQFARAQFANDAIPSWLICDSRFIRRYGLGAVRPGATGLKVAVRSGYLTARPDLRSLAQAIGVDAEGLANTVRQMNRFAQTGVDEDFGKGADSLSRQNGDPAHDGPNPCLAAIETAPYYAVAVTPTDLGTSRGLLTNGSAQLLDKAGQAIPGLYACGNDMQSVMGGQYPAPGVTLGPAMTFAYIAAQHCVFNLRG